ncbi:condensation domain-containing protein, partial [Streptacidiphilus sp. N1-12]
MSVPAGSGGSFPLTTAQLGVCLAHHLGPDGSTYNLAKYVEILGPVDPAAFEAALLQAGRECGAFDIRLVLAEDGRTPAQEVRPTSQTPRFVDLTGEADPESAAQDWMDADWRAPVDLMDGSLFTDVLFRVEGERYFWYSRCHHVLVDGYGDELLTRRIAALYTAAVLGDSDTLTDSAFQGGPRELVADEEAYRASPRYAEDRAYWVSRFADLPPVPHLGATAPEQVTGTGLRRRSRLSARDLDRLRAAAREGRTTWTVLLAAAVAAYLRTATGLDEVTVGIPVTGRRPATLRTPGMLANELPLRVDVSPWQTKRELLRQVAGGLSDLLRRQHYPYDDLRRELGVEEPLFGPTLNIFSFEEKLTFGGLPTVQHRLANGPVRDLNITVSVGAASGIGDGLLIDFDANPTVYGPAEVEAHQRHFLALLNSLVEAGPEVPVGRIGVLGAAERAEVLARSTGAPVTGAPASVLDMFTAQVERTPDAPAVIADDQDLTYRQLDEQAGQLAAAIRPRLHGVEPRVAILLERSSRTVITALAVLKAGGVYVPLDHHAPHERHTTVLAQADAQLLITDRPHPTDLPVLDPDARANAAEADPVHPDALACLLFTSGSTGVPKGVALTHRGITDLVRDHGFSGAANRILLHAS